MFPVSYQFQTKQTPNTTPGTSPPPELHIQTASSLPSSPNQETQAANTPPPLTIKYHPKQEPSPSQETSLSKRVKAIFNTSTLGEDAARFPPSEHRL